MRLGEHYEGIEVLSARAASAGLESPAKPRSGCASSRRAASALDAAFDTGHESRECLVRMLACSGVPPHAGQHASTGRSRLRAIAIAGNEPPLM
jgi:hypothetical protein